MLETERLKEIYGNEQLLLLLLARLYFGSCGAEEVNGFIAGQPVEWDLLYKMARAHAIGSFIYYIITVFKIKVDTRFESRLKQRYLRTRFKNFRQLHFAVNLTSELRERGITAIPYKGAFFAHNYYKDIGLRESVDVDILVSKTDVEAIEDYFVKENYKPMLTVARAYLGYYLAFFKDIAYLPPDLNASIEIHWRMVDRFSSNYPSYDFFSKHLVPCRIGDMTVDGLPPSYDFLAVASNHFVKDMSIKFKYLIDMACLINKERASLDADIIFSCAEHYGFKKKLDMGLEVTKQLLGVEWITGHSAALPEEILKTPLEYPIHLSRLYINNYRFIRRSLQLQDNLRNQVKFVLRCLLYFFLPTSSDIQEIKLPICFLPVLIILRPLRLVYSAAIKK